MNNNKYYYITNDTLNGNTYYGIQVSEESLYNLIDNMTIDELYGLHCYVTRCIKHRPFKHITLSDLTNKSIELEKITLEK